MEGEEEPASDEDEAGGQESRDEPTAEETVRGTSGPDSPGHAVQQALGQAQGGREGGGEEGEDEEDGGVEGVVPEDDGVEAGVLSNTGTAFSHHPDDDQDQRGGYRLQEDFVQSNLREEPLLSGGSNQRIEEG